MLLFLTGVSITLQLPPFFFILTFGTLDSDQLYSVLTVLLLSQTSRAGHNG
jgi:hypothetical protein